jgi:hypothetical protein
MILSVPHLLVLAPSGSSFPVKGSTLIPAYVGLQVSTLPIEKEERIVVTRHDDPKAVMIFYRKMLVYAGWQVIEGRVLEGDGVIVFARGARRLKMIDDSPPGNTTRVLFTLAP